MFVDRLHNIHGVGFFEPYLRKETEPETLSSQFTNGAKWAGWWDRYMDKVCDLLNQTPHSLVAQSPTLLRDIQSIIASGCCDRCKERRYKELVKFSAMLSRKIEVLSEGAY